MYWMVVSGVGGVGGVGVVKVNWSADEVAEVPPNEVVTVMSTVPLPAGLVAVIDVTELTTKLLAATPPNLTVVVPPKTLPVMVTVVPPAVDPDEGLTDVTVGAGTLNSKAPRSGVAARAAPR